MPSVVIDGVEYAPVGESGNRIGIGITTRNRNSVLEETLTHLGKYLPPGAKLVVVDDASSTPVPEANFRFTENVGIARAKNKCLELLDDCGHIFLFDDDTYPVVDKWWEPYVTSPEPHLMYLWVHAQVATDGQHVARYNPQGAMLYFDRKVLDVVGGFDPVFGVYGSEHGDLSNRIHAFGLTTWRYADVVGSENLFFCHDRDTSDFKSTVSQETKDRDIEVNRPLRWSRQNTPLYVEYREKTNVVATPLLTGQPDHKYKKRWKADTEILTNLRKSVSGHRFVVLHDELTETSTPDMELVQVPTHGLNPYLQRWVSSFHWLRDQHDIGFVWFVDGSDVEMLNDPFPDMESGTLYLGSEIKLLSFPWMIENHPGYAEFLSEYGNRQMLNAGLVGGDRDTVLRFLRLLVREIWDNVAERTRNHRHPDLGLGDMALLNHVAYTQYDGPMVTGPLVNTVFKADERNGWSWWKHK